MLTENAIHEHQPPPIRQGIREKTVNAMMGRRWRRMQLRIERQLKRRQTVVVLDVRSIVLKEHALAVLGQHADSTFTAPLQAANDLQLPYGLKLTHRKAPLRCCEAFVTAPQLV